MNETPIKEERTEPDGDVDADSAKWAPAIQGLIRIIEKSEQKLGYFQNRVKQAQFMDRPNQRKIRTASAQIGMHSAHLEGLHTELRQLERLHGGGIHLRPATSRELRRIWGWINRPGIRNILYAARVPFETFMEDWQQWTESAEMYPLSIEICTTRLLIGFMLLQGKADTVVVEFVVIRPDQRARGYGTDALTEAVHYAFEHLNAEHITLQVAPDNDAALTCFENAGFQYLSYTEAAGPAYTMGIDLGEWVGDGPVGDQSTAPQLRATLQEFFELED